MSIDRKTQLLKLADQCVMCGMCSPHCPTYMKTSNEAESPRGRISLMQALLRDNLALDESLQQHLDSCLSCRACEAICPSGVNYGELIDGARAIQREQNPGRGWIKEQLLETTASSKKLRSNAKLYRLAQFSGLDKLLKKGAKHFITQHPNISQLFPDKLPAYQPWQESYSAIGEQRGHIALFTGCIADIVDQQTLRDAITLLTHCGYRVSVPHNQACCGALHHHSGDQAHSLPLAEQNISAFSTEPYDRIIHCASGCGTHLMEYHKLQEGKAAQDFSSKVDEISHFLLQHGIERLRFTPMRNQVAVHLPCTQRNVLKQRTNTLELLALIPEIEAIPLASNHFCCGAAGSYMLEQPEMSQQLRQDKLDDLAQLHAEILLSSNIGCAMHLAAGLREQGSAMEVIHPISLLARQLII